MTESKLKNQIGFLLIIINVLLIILTIVLYLFGGFMFDELTTILAIIVPMFSVYTTAIIKYIVDNKHFYTHADEQVSKQYVIISWFFPIIFGLFMATALILKSFNFGISSFEQLKYMLVASETFFGGHAGLILSSMFESKKSSRY